MELTEAQNTATLMTAPAKTESAIDDDRFSLTSGLTKSVEHLSELETISNSSTRVDVQVVKIADTTLMKHIEENSKWIDDGGKFQECCVRGGDGSTIFHTGDEAMSAEREDHTQRDKAFEKLLCPTQTQTCWRLE